MVQEGRLIKTRDNRLIANTVQNKLLREDEADDFVPTFTTETKILYTWKAEDLVTYNKIKQAVVDMVAIVVNEKSEFVPSEKGWIVFITWNNQVL